MNKNVISVTRFVAAGLAALALAACEAKKSSNPLGPSVAGPIAGVEITAPKLIEPAQGFKFKEKQQPIKLVIENSITNGVRTVSYLFEVASDSEFNTKVFARSGVAAGEGGRTSVQIDALELGRGYYWRARAEDGANSSTYSTAQFELLPRAQLAVPGVVSPINDERVTTRRPTLRVNASDRNSAIGSVSYFFMVAKDSAFTQISATGIVEEQTSWTVDRELDPNLRHFWRVYATDGETSTAWSPTHQFLTPTSGSGGGGGSNSGCSGGGRAADPASGQLPLQNMFHVVQWVASNYPNALANSCQSQGGTWEFMDRVVDELRKCDTRWGYNGKRGNSGDPSHDAVAYHYSRGADEGSTDVYIIDVIVGHCGNPGPAWIDVTEATRQGGTIGRWTSRGRF